MKKEEKKKRIKERTNEKGRIKNKMREIKKIQRMKC